MLQFYYTCIKPIAIHLAVWYHILAADERTKKTNRRRRKPTEAWFSDTADQTSSPFYYNLTAKDASEIFSIQKRLPGEKPQKRYHTEDFE